MEIIGCDQNHWLQKQSHHFCRGFLTGPIRIIGGIAEAAINAVVLVLTVIPSMGGLISDQSEWHAFVIATDEVKAICHIFRGIVEFFPGTSFIIDKFNESDSKKYDKVEDTDRCLLDESWPCLYEEASYHQIV